MSKIKKFLYVSFVPFVCVLFSILCSLIVLFVTKNSVIASITCVFIFIFPVWDFWQVDRLKKEHEENE